MVICGNVFQSTHPRGVRPTGWTEGGPFTFQSTHPRGVRPTGRLNSLAFFCFNPRTRAGCDGDGPAYKKKDIDVQSTTNRAGCDMSSLAFRCGRGFHPRTRAGCDYQVGGSLRVERSFNPRTRAGCDSCRTGSISTPASFNPATHPRGVRLNKAGPVNSAGDSFNPRTRAGCDIIAEPAQPQESVSSTHPRGCDLQGFLPICLHVSIHAPARGATDLPLGVLVSS